MTQRSKPPFAVVLGGMIGVGLLFALIRCATEGEGPTPSPKPPRSPRTTAAPASTAPACRRAELPAAHATLEDWDRTLVDPAYALPSDYAPTDLEPVSKAGFLGDTEVRSFVLQDLKKLNKAAEDDGIDLGIVVAYRSWDKQDELFQERVQLSGKERALAGTARPGHSEHQLGTTVDFRDAAAQDVSRSWGSEPEGIWMEENAWRFGFVLSYPRNREAQTCYMYEPWHYRYMGREAAAQIESSGLTLREWLWNEGRTDGGA